ncbi:MAG TPA: M23 family metallopeptidase [Vicinamibacterales bacterium]|jgi:murein DD-endopeptidase MepM/ murein hydrolase activator NlpD|nr:M23 family metallopeptidase [Vicinamibacterales bacterium]
MLRWLIRLLLLAAVAFGGVYFIAGRGRPPAIVIDKPGPLVGQNSTVEVSVEGPPPTAMTVTLSQDGADDVALFSLDRPDGATVTPAADGKSLRVSRPFGKRAVPELKQGRAHIVVNASRPSIFGLRTLSSSASKDIDVRLEPPRVSVVSTHHYVNRGGSEMVMYRVTPADVESGVRVGAVEYPGFAAGGDASLKIAFFALLTDQPSDTPIAVFGRDAAGNEATVSFVDKVFDKTFKKSRIEIDDRFLQRVVPEILAHAPELKLDPAAGASDLLGSFLRINGDLRKMNADRIAELTRPTSPTRLWDGPFVQLGNSQVEAGFADARTYLYRGKEVDQQVHLGFDLAVTAAVPVVAANAGTVVNASWLGIYGNCVIIDHGMGVASLYGHLSSIDVKVGDRVTKGQTLGKSGMTGLAGGDHLHFTMLVAGHPVNPVEWWDLHWISDRVDRKLKEAGAAQ